VQSGGGGEIAAGRCFDGCYNTFLKHPANTTFINWIAVEAVNVPTHITKTQLKHPCLMRSAVAHNFGTRPFITAIHIRQICPGNFIAFDCNNNYAFAKLLLAAGGFV
jgi:hypothetical protein